MTLGGQVFPVVVLHLGRSYSIVTAYWVCEFSTHQQALRRLAVAHRDQLGADLLDFIADLV
jgi:hypothetical protein